MVGERLEQRRLGFKSRGMTGDESRRRREEASVEIRKVKREESLNKKRASTINQVAHAAEISSGDEDNFNDELPVVSSELIQRIPQMMSQINSSSLADQLAGATTFRKVLSRVKNPPIDTVIQSGAIPRLVQFLRGPQASFDGMSPEAAQTAYENLQFESAWALTNIASGNSHQTWTVVQHDSIPAFLQLLNSSNDEVKEQAIWALGNIAGDSPTCRDLVLNGGIIPPLLSVIHEGAMSEPIKLPLVRNACWTFSNLCRGKPVPEWSKVSAALPLIAGLLTTGDQEILSDSCWSLSYLSDGPNDHIEDVIRSGVVPRVVQLLTHESCTVQIPALRTIGNIVTGSDAQTQVVLACGALNSFHYLLNSPKASIVKEGCWALSNITAGSAEQIQAVIDSNLIPILIHLLSTADFKIKREACWAISNATSGKTSNPQQVQYLVGQSCLRPMCDILKCQDNKLILVTLDGIDAILEVGESLRFSNPEMINQYAVMVEECGGMDYIYDLQSHRNEDIYRKSKSILDKYYSEEETDFDLGTSTSSVNPQTGSFQFNMDQNSAMPQGGFSFQ